MARTGKIARLPLKVQNALNLRLLDGEAGSRILPWLNELPETKSALAEYFEGEPVRDQNLSEWRKGGYRDWLARREQIDRTRDLATFATDLAKAQGHSIADGAAAIAAGKLLGILEGVGEEPKPETLEMLTVALARLRKGDHAAQRLRQLEIRLDQAGEMLALEREKFQRHTCELFIKWAADHRATEIATGSSSNADKLEEVGKLMFGDLWK
jgi:hypothetical protein